MTLPLLVALALLAAPVAAQSVTRDFTLPAHAEVVASITASCAQCDWGVSRREAVVLEVRVDGGYSQHVVLTRAETSSYRILLGAREAGSHGLTIQRDRRHSAPDAGIAVVDTVTIETYTELSPEYSWLSHAPFLRARPGSLERFSDVPLLMYVEQDVPRGENGVAYRFQYTTVFSNEDGGTPADRLMATWGRTTDIEFVYGVTADGSRSLIQANGHTWVDFRGPTFAGHPELWVATDNNMVADSGAIGLVRFAPAPKLVVLRERSREAVMDAEPWTYRVASSEAMREGRVDPAARAGTGRIVDPRRYATVEICADVTDAAIAMDVGVRDSSGSVRWYATDHEEPLFRIARGGCARGGAALPANAVLGDIVGLRVRAFDRPPGGSSAASDAKGRVTLRSVNQISMLDSMFVPAIAPNLRWSGDMPIATGGTSTMVISPRER